MKELLEQAFSRPLKDLPSNDFISIEASSAAAEVIRIIQENKVEMIEVVENGAFVGVINNASLMQNLNTASTALDFVDERKQALNEDATVEDAIKMLLFNDSFYIYTEDSSKMPKSYISILDIFSFVHEKLKDELEPYGTVFEWKSYALDEHDGDLLPFDTDISSTDCINDKFYLNPLSKLGYRKLETIDHKSTLNHLLDLFIEKNASIVAVTEYDTEYVGIISTSNIVTALDKIDSFGQLLVRDLMVTNPDSLLLSHRLCYAMNNIAKRRYRNIIFVDKDFIPTNYLSIIDILRFIYTRYIENQI